MGWLALVVLALLALLALSAVLTRRLTAHAERLVPPIGRFVELPGCRLHVVEAGEARAGVPPVIMLHGLGGQVRHFSYQLVDDLARDTRVVAIDRPGSGWSQREPGADAGLPAQADLVMDLCDRLGLVRPLVVGHSLGGALALTIAARHGERIAGLALLAPLTHMPRALSPVFRGLRVPAALRTFIARTLAAPLVRLQGPMLLRVVFAPEAVPADYADRGGGALSMRPSQFIAAAEDLEAAPHSVDALDASYEKLARSTLPLHMIFGRQDHILSCEENAVAFARRVPHTRLSLVDGGHMLPVTQPAPCAELIRAALLHASAVQATAAPHAA